MAKRSPIGSSSRYRYPVVAFDLDGTLLADSSVSLLLADWQDKTEEIEELERAFRAGEISNSVVADTQAAWLQDRSVAEVWEVLARGPWIAGIGETLNALHQAGVQSLLATITWSFAAEFLAERYRFAAVSGTEMHTCDGVLSGRVRRYFDEYDKLTFVEEWCEAHGHPMDEVAAIGDSRSDIPLFAAVGRSIALNATPDAAAAASDRLDSRDLRDVLALLQTRGR